MSCVRIHECLSVPVTVCHDSVLFVFYSIFPSIQEGKPPERVKLPGIINPFNRRLAMSGLHLMSKVSRSGVRGQGHTSSFHSIKNLKSTFVSVHVYIKRLELFIGF